MNTTIKRGDLDKNGATLCANFRTAALICKSNNFYFDYQYTADIPVPKKQTIYQCFILKLPLTETACIFVGGYAEVDPE